MVIDKIVDCRDVHASVEMAAGPMFHYFIALHNTIYCIRRIVQSSSFEN